MSHSFACLLNAFEYEGVGGWLITVVLEEHG
jgi:hypothetical protein